MAPFQAVPTPDGESAPAESRAGRSAPADVRVEERRRAEDERRQAERRAQAERLDAERRAAEERRAAAEQREAGRRAALQREEEERQAEIRAAEEREAEQQRAAERRVAEARAEAERRAAELRAMAAAQSTRTDDDRSAPWSTGPAGSRPGPPAPASGRAAVPAASGPAYGDWTRPRSSAAEDTVAAPPFIDDDEDDYSSQRFARLRAGAPPETTAIPEREVAARRAREREEPASSDRAGDELHPSDRGDELRHSGRGDDEPLTSTTTIGGRAALRAERQAADAARRKAAKNRPADPDAPRDRRSPRRAMMGLVAVAVVALGVLGVYSYASPKAKETSSSSSATAASGAATGTVPGVADLPALSTAAPAPTTTAAAPVKVPVTVLNATDINGLAASIAGVIKAGGWQTTQVGAYTHKDVAASTVYFTQGDATQQQAAQALVTQFPQLHGPAQRFFDVPGNAAPGLVVVATGEWKP